MPRTRTTRRTVAGVAVLTSVAVAGLSGAAAASATFKTGKYVPDKSTAAKKAPEKAYTIGVFGDFSSVNAGTGLSFRGGIEAYINSVNGKGGVNGHQITVDAYDDQSQTTIAASNFNEFLSSASNIVSVTGSTYAPDCLAIAPLAQAQGISEQCLTVAPTTLASDPYIYTAQPPTPNQAAPDFAFAKKLLGSKLTSIGVLVINSPTSTPFGQNLQTLASAANVSATVESMAVTDPDPAVQVSEILQAKPSVIFTNGLDTQTEILYQQMQEQGLNVPIIYEGQATAVATVAGFNDPNFYYLSAFSFISKSVETTAPPAIAKLSARIAKEKQQVSSAKRGAQKKAKAALASLVAQEQALKNQLAYAQEMTSVGQDPLGGGTGVQGYLDAEIIVAALKKCGDSCTSAVVQSELQSGKIQASSIGLAASPTVGYGPGNQALVDAVGAWKWDTTTKTLQEVQSAEDLKTVGSV